MPRSPITRCIAFGLSLIATAILALASGFSIVLCVEPDGCVELELIATGDSSSSGCIDHEHEAGQGAAGGRELSAECPCQDTVLALLADSARAKPAKLKHNVTPDSPARLLPIAAAVPFFVCPRDRSTDSGVAMHPIPSRIGGAWRYARESSVLRN